MFKKIDIETLQFNPVTMIGEEWMLISAGNRKKFNTMTASWGSLGQMWGRRNVTVYIHPQCHTREFVDDSKLFTLSFFPPEYRKALELCGTKSGRDADKAAEAGLTPYFIGRTVAFEQASLILICRKLHSMAFSEEGFTAPEVMEKFYPEEDFHIIYTGEILKALTK